MIHYDREDFVLVKMKNTSVFAHFPKLFLVPVEIFVPEVMGFPLLSRTKYRTGDNDSSLVTQPCGHHPKQLLHKGDTNG